MTHTTHPSVALGAALSAFLVMATLWLPTLAAPGSLSAAPPVAAVTLPLVA